MRILKVTQAYYPFQDKGGPVVKVRSLAKLLVSRGHTVTVLTADLGMQPKYVVLTEVNRDGDGWRSTQDGVEAIYLKTRARYRSLTINAGVKDFCRRRRHDFDIIQVYGLYDLLAPEITSFFQQRGIPYLVEPMGMFCPIVRNIWLKRLHHHLFGYEMLSGAQKIVATSDQEQRELIEGGLPKEKIVVRRNGVSAPEVLPAPGTFRRKYGIADGTKIVLFLGRIVSKKAPDLLLRSFAKYRNSRESADSTLLVLAGPDGDAGYRRELNSLIARLGLSESVLFPGPLYDELKWAAYRDADVFVLPSQNENFGNTVAEAVASGTPVIVTDRCGVAPAIDQRAGIVVQYDEVSLQRALTEMLHDDRLLNRLREGCLDVARSLSWQEPLEMMERLYENVLRTSITRVPA